MKFAKRALVTSALIAGLTAGTVSAASADSPVWDYGVTGIPGAGTSYSHYYHPTVCHGATAVGSETVRTPDIAGGSWARADAPRAIGNNQAYRRNC